MYVHMNHLLVHVLTHSRSVTVHPSTRGRLGTTLVKSRPPSDVTAAGDSSIRGKGISSRGKRDSYPPLRVSSGSGFLNPNGVDGVSGLTPGIRCPLGSYGSVKGTTPSNKSSVDVYWRLGLRGNPS